MKLTKSKLKQIIKEEKKKLLKEQWGTSSIETGSDLIEFSRAYASLGAAVQEQVDQLISAYFNSGGPDSEDFEEAAFSVNPNAIDLALERLSRPGRMLGGEAEDILHALDTAKEITRNADGT